MDLPGGAAEEGETLLEAAYREFEEETGFVAKKLKWLGKYRPGPSTQIVVSIFFTRDVKSKGEFDQNEIANVELVNFKTIVKRVLKGECFDSALTIAVLLVALEKLLSS